jgi:hypothetical protein
LIICIAAFVIYVYIIVTSHGKPIARIMPLLDAKTEAKNHLAKLRTTCRIEDIFSPIEMQWDASS